MVPETGGLAKVGTLAIRETLRVPFLKYSPRNLPRKPALVHLLAGQHRLSKCMRALEELSANAVCDLLIGHARLMGTNKRSRYHAEVTSDSASIQTAGNRDATQNISDKRHRRDDGWPVREHRTTLDARLASFGAKTERFGRKREMYSADDERRTEPA